MDNIVLSVRRGDLGKACLDGRRMYVYVRIYNHGSDVIAAVCDEELLGLTFRDGGVVLDVSRDFFGGSKVLVDDVVDVLSRATLVILVGKNSVGKALESGLVHPSAVMEVSGIPYAYIIKL